MCFYVGFLYHLFLFYFIQVAEGAKAAGASRIIGVDIDPKKASLGRFDYVLFVFEKPNTRRYFI